MLSRQLPGGADFILPRLLLRAAKGGGQEAGRVGWGREAGGGRRRQTPAETERPGLARVYYIPATCKG